VTPPHFIVIGAMKAATSTLHEQLGRQPGLYLSRPKEPCFFSDDDVYARGIDWYRGLFAAAPPGSICGESSTHYTKRPTYPRTVERLGRHLGPGVRFVYMMRHPVERLISQYVHEWSVRRIELPIEEAIDRHPELVDYGRYAWQLEPWVDRFGAAAVLPVVTERLKRDPQGELERVCAFIGGPARPRWDPALPPQNVSSTRRRRSRVRDLLLDLPGAAAVRRAVVAAALRERVRAGWTTPARPALSPGTRERLTALFDEDLARLEGMLGLRLSCAALEAMA
jgi:hypothetical protein